MASSTSDICKGIQKTIDWCEGTPEIGGVSREVYYACISDIVDEAKIPVDKKGRPTSATLQGEYKFAADCVAQRIDILPEKSKFSSDPQGEYPSQSQLDKLNLYHPSIGPVATAACCYINNAPCIFWFKDSQGRWRVVGSKRFPIKNTVTQDGGEGPTGSPSTVINVESTNIVSAPYYTGKLLTVDGEIDCSTDTVTPDTEGA